MATATASLATGVNLTAQQQKFKAKETNSAFIIVGMFHVWVEYNQITTHHWIWIKKLYCIYKYMFAGSWSTEKTTFDYVWAKNIVTC